MELRTDAISGMERNYAERTGCGRLDSSVTRFATVLYRAAVQLSLLIDRLSYKSDNAIS